MLTNNKCGHCDRIVTILIVNFFNAHLKTASSNLLKTIERKFDLIKYVISMVKFRTLRIEKEGRLHKLRSC